MNDNQTASIFCDEDSCVYFDHQEQLLVDIDNLMDIQSIKELEYDSEDKCFYIIGNRFNTKFGVFIAKFDEMNPQDFEFILKMKTGLMIDCADIEIIRDKVNMYKELIITFKTQYLNTFNLQVLDLSTKTPHVIYKIETTQLWESNIRGFSIPKSQDYVFVNSSGLNLINLSNSTK